MTSMSPVAVKRTDMTAAIVLLLLAEATLFFTFHFIIGPIATPARLLPLVVVLVLCAALYRGLDWVRWGLLAPVSFRVWTIVRLIAAAWEIRVGPKRTSTRRFLHGWYREAQLRLTRRDSPV